MSKLENYEHDVGNYVLCFNSCGYMDPVTELLIILWIIIHITFTMYVKLGSY